MNLLRKFIYRYKRQNISETVKDFKSILLGLWYSFKVEATKPFYVMGKITILNKYGTISVGQHTRIWKGVKLSAYSESKREEPRIIIGRECSIGDRTEIHAGREVRIGNRVMFAWDCVIMDRDYHSVNSNCEKMAPVNIEDDVWIGCRAIVLKGVSIGKNAVIGAGSVVLDNIPENAIVAGNPAKIIGYKS
jgi:acetyltransferase-like isoleucine patch superfamily enzyme